MKEGIADRIRAAGGEIYAVTSEPQALARQAKEEWELDFECVGDPHHEIRETCRRRGWLDLFVNTHVDVLRRSADWEPQHPKGYFQPGVIALDASGRVLYRWRGIPTRRNMGGAGERPRPEHVWSSIAECLAEPERAGDAPLDAAPPVDARGIPWPLFVALLVANGWFVRPRGFALLRDGAEPLRRVLLAALRLLAFVAAWIAAFLTLPVAWVGLALACWVAWILPGIRRVHTEFQNERGPASQEG